MAKKIFGLVAIWVCVIFAYIIMALTMPATNEIVGTVNATLASGASGNMSNFPGTQEFVQTFPIWGWALPGLVGVIMTVMMMVKKD